MVNDPYPTVSFTTIIAYAWLFVSVVAGLANLAQYLYRHLQWI